MIQDAQGHAVSGATAASVAHFDQGIEAFSLSYGDALGQFDAAREAAPDFAMAHLGKAWVFSLAFDPAMAGRAGDLAATAAGLPLNDRERAHLAALEHTLAGSRAAAVAILDRHLMHHPFDLLAHEMALFLDLFQGRVRWMRDRTARALPRWPTNLPGHAAMLAFHAFGLEENADFAQAEARSRAALDLEPNNHFAHHTVSHVMEMTGRPEDGLGWMAARERYWASDSHPNQVHIWWHKALFHIELGQFDAALALYDGPIRATQRPIAMALTNASALLWRLHTIGLDVSARWRELAALWDGRVDGKCLVFSDLHAAMAGLGSGQEASVERLLTAMRNTAAAGDASYRDVGVPLVEGLMAFHRGAFDDAVAHLLPARFELWRIGGSAAQRDVIDWTLTEAALRGGARDVALSLAHERLSARPRSHVNRDFLRRAEGIAA